MSDIEGNMNAFKINCDGCSKAAEKKKKNMVINAI